MLDTTLLSLMLSHQNKAWFIATICCDLVFVAHNQKNVLINHFGYQPEVFGYLLLKKLQLTTIIIDLCMILSCVAMVKSYRMVAMDKFFLSKCLPPFQSKRDVMFHVELAVTLRLRPPFFENDNRFIPANPQLSYSLV